MKLSAILAPLVAAGVDAATILKAVEAWESQQTDALERRRANDRERQERRRHVTSRDVTVTVSSREGVTRVEDISSNLEISGQEERKKESKARAALTPVQELETVLDSERARAVVEHRQRLRKPLTAHAARLLAGKLSKAPEPNAAADTMIGNGWQGFELDWLQTRPRQGTGPPNGKRMNAVEANRLISEQDHERASQERHNGDAELLPANEPRLRALVADLGGAMRWDQ